MSYDQRPMGSDELAMYARVAGTICEYLDMMEKRATPEHKAAAMLVARFELFRVQQGSKACGSA